MMGLGTLIDIFGIIVGAILGRIFGKYLLKRHQDMLLKMCGIATMLMGLAGAMENMLSVTGNKLVAGRGLFLILCLTAGGLIGEIFEIEKNIESFGTWLKKKTGSKGDSKFVTAFVNTSLTVCIGAMAIVGAINDGLMGDYSILVAKAVLDLVLLLVMTASLGRGCVFCAIPTLIIQGSITFLSKLLSPYITGNVLGNISLVGNVMVLCVGLNLVFGKKVKVANLLPGILFAIILALVPINI